MKLAIQYLNDSKGNVNKKSIGKDIDTWVDFREHSTYSSSMALSLNTESFVIPFFIALFVMIPPCFPKFSDEYTRFRSAVAVKFVQRFGILKKTIIF